MGKAKAVEVQGAVRFNLEESEAKSMERIMKHYGFKSYPEAIRAMIKRSIIHIDTGR